ncbi:hypothetical protein BRC81_14760 [Halobacteriales archaeon QS_1_68_20]|nr:MAG: hypothetical protein BRC81_14760 [Halobacteriales archaeon QS_1_68_20]
MGDADRGPRVTDREILAVFAEMDGNVLHDEDVADELPLSNELLVDRLDDLEERGLVETADEDVPGERWRLTAAGQRAADLPEPEVETDVEAQAAKTTDSATATREEETPESPPPDPQEGEGSPPGDPSAQLPSEVPGLEAFDPPGDTRQKERRRGLVRRAYAYLREQGAATRENFVADVYSTTPADYEDPDDRWEQVVGPGLETLPTVEKDGDVRRFAGADQDESG